MKKVLLFLAAATLVVSCNKLKENEYEITGKVDASLNGKNVFLEKQQAGMMGAPSKPDTAKVENGKFIFKGIATEPGLYFITIDGQPKDMDHKLDFIVEEGEITLKVDKDSLFKSERGGTYNNEKIQEYMKVTEANTKAMKNFRAKNTAKMQEAMMKQDTATVNKINKEWMDFQKKTDAILVDFVKKNPKAYINVYLMRQIAGNPERNIDESIKMYDTLDKDVKKTKEGVETKKMLDEKKKQLTMPPVQPQAAPQVPQPTAPAPAQK